MLVCACISISINMIRESFDSMMIWYEILCSMISMISMFVLFICGIAMEPVDAELWHSIGGTGYSKFLYREQSADAIS